jgi:hypothetical protein
MRATIRIAPLALLVAAGACQQDLQVDNLTAPDVEKVFALPATIEQTISTGYQVCHNAVTNNGIMPEIATYALESYSALNNFNMGVRAAIPRSPLPNGRGTPSIFGEFSSLSRNARLAVNAIDALDRLIKEGRTLGTDAQNLRAKSFGYFVTACNLGKMALLYDSSAVVSPGMGSDSIPELSGAATVMNAALSYLDSAVAIALRAPASGSGGFPVPDNWLGGTAMSRDDYVRLLRSWRARLRANVARTPAQRNAANWDAIIADAENGITTDYLVNVGGSTGWNIGYYSSQAYQERAWHQVSPMYYGMADVSGEFDRWIATPLNQRYSFVVRTPDRRWPAGATRAEQRAASTNPTGINSLPWLKAEQTDSPGDAWGVSPYTFQRMRFIRLSNNTGTFIEFAKAENDLLLAEGYLRKGRVADAARLIDKTRNGRAGLPALTGVVTTATQPVPGDANCVPKVPQGPAFTTVACGNIWEAMKYEYRMETAFTAWGSWYFPMRGWGDLVEGTPLEYPIPYQEMDARQRPFYALGGQGGKSSAGKGTYGY